MKADYFDIRKKWGIIFVYGLRRLDEYEMRAMMMSFGMRGSEIDDAVDTLLYEENTGICVSRDDIRMSLVFIGKSTGGDQFWDTTAHEVLYHAACAIFDYYDVPYGSEDAAWTVGYLMRMAVQKLGEPCL